MEEKNLEKVENENVYVDEIEKNFKSISSKLLRQFSLSLNSRKRMET